MIPSQRPLFDIPDGVACLNCACMVPLHAPAGRDGDAGSAARGTSAGVEKRSRAP